MLATLDDKYMYKNNRFIVQLEDAHTNHIHVDFCRQYYTKELKELTLPMLPCLHHVHGLCNSGEPRDQDDITVVTIRTSNYYTVPGLIPVLLSHL